MLLFPAFCDCADDSVNWLADGTTLCGLWMLVVVVVVVDADLGNAGAFDIAVDDFLLALSGRTGLLLALVFGDTANLSPTKLCTLLARP